MRWKEGLREEEVRGQARGLSKAENQDEPLQDEGLFVFDQLRLHYGADVQQTPRLGRGGGGGGAGEHVLGIA